MAKLPQSGLPVTGRPGTVLKEFREADHPRGPDGKWIDVSMSDIRVGDVVADQTNPEHPGYEVTRVPEGGGVRSAIVKDPDTGIELKYVRPLGSKAKARRPSGDAKAGAGRSDGKKAPVGRHAGRDYSPGAGEYPGEVHSNARVLDNYSDRQLDNHTAILADKRRGAERLARELTRAQGRDDAAAEAERLGAALDAARTERDKRSAEGGPEPERRSLNRGQKRATGALARQLERDGGPATVEEVPVREPDPDMERQRAEERRAEREA